MHWFIKHGGSPKVKLVIFNKTSHKSAKTMFSSKNTKFSYDSKYSNLIFFSIIARFSKYQTDFTTKFMIKIFLRKSQIENCDLFD